MKRSRTQWLSAIVVTLTLVAAAVVLLIAPSNAETPAERCARETATYNSAWEQTWRASNPGNPGPPPPPPVPYVCRDPGPPTETTTTTAPPSTFDLDAPNNENPESGIHVDSNAPTNMPQSDEGFIVPVPTRPRVPLPTTQVKPKPLPPKPSQQPRPRTPDGNSDDDAGDGPSISEDERDEIANDLIDNYLKIPCRDEESLVPRQIYEDRIRQAIDESWQRGDGTAGINNAGAVETGTQNVNARANCHNNRSRDKSECSDAEFSSRCTGPVAICPMDGETATEAAQRAEYISKSNASIPSSGFLKKAPNDPQLQKESDQAIRDEKSANGDRYPSPLVVGHAPDKTWGKLPKSPNGFIPMSRGLNSSIAGQSNAYPVGYRATEFTQGTRFSTGNCELLVLP